MSDTKAVLTGEVVGSEVVAIAPAQVHLGSLAIHGPKQLVTQATELANSLADIITTQKLFSVIKQRKYVFVEGWTTLGAMLGVVPVEESCVPITDDAGKPGFLAKVRLIRAADGGQVGGASAECTRSENTWATRDSYTLRSMAITRATGKSFRLSFSWIMKLAGFEPTPAEEMSQAMNAEREEGEREAKKIADQHIKDYSEKTASQIKGKSIALIPGKKTVSDDEEIPIVYLEASPVLAILLDKGLGAACIYDEKARMRWVADDPQVLDGIESFCKEYGVTVVRKQAKAIR